MMHAQVRLSLRFPDVRDMLLAGSLTLTTINLLSPHLTLENYPTLLRAAAGKTKEEVRALVAPLAPKPDVHTVVRRLRPAAAWEPAGSRMFDLTQLARVDALGADPEQGESSAVVTSVDEPHRLSSAAGDKSAGPVANARGFSDGRTVSSVAGTEPLVSHQGDPAVEPALAVSDITATSDCSPRSRTSQSSSPKSFGPSRLSGPRVLLVPLSADRYLLRLTIGGETHTKLRYAQNLSRHSIPSGDLATILDRALTLYVRDLERVKLARVDRPRARKDARATQPSTARSDSRSRRIPSEVRRAVWLRDGGRCTFVGPAGRCGEVGWLEFHHVIPFAAGGPATVDNITLRCRAHNQYEADRYFGPDPADHAAS